MTRGLGDLLYTARDGLAAQSFGLSVTGQNVSNVNTPGYGRRNALLETRGAGLYGVHVLGVQRVSDVLLERQQFQATGLSASASERDGQLAQLEGLFDDGGGTGLADSLGALFASFSSLASNPSDPTARGAVLSRADALAGRVNDMANTIASGREDLLKRAQATTAEVNQRATEVAKLNQEISNAKARGEDTSELEDKRNQVLLGMSSLIDVRTMASDDGSITVQASGTTLVEGKEARQLSVDLAPGGNLRILANTAAGATTDVSNFLTGGKLAGIREARDQDYVAIAQKLDTFVTDVATAINTQHAAGYGLDGVNGRNLFDFTAGAGAARSLKLSVDVAGQPDHLAAASSATALPGGSDNAVALSMLADAAISGGGTAADAYAAIVGDVGSRKAGAAEDVALRDSITAQVTARRESVSGVSLDEEMVALTKYQRAYEASAKLLTTVDSLLEELIARLGR